MEIGKFIKELKEVEEFVKTQSFLKQLGLDLVDRIRVRTRLGKGAKGIDQPAHNLPELKDSTKKRRRLLKNSGELTGPNAIPSKSGLNRTGKMLNRLHSRVSGSLLEIKLDSYGERVAKHLLERDPDWEFMNVSMPEYKGLIRDISDIIRKELQRRIK